MDMITEEALSSFLDKAGITRHITRDMSYKSIPARTIEIHFGETDFPSYAQRVMALVLSLSPEWYLIPRYGNVEEMNLVEKEQKAAAIRFLCHEQDALSRYLVGLPMDMGVSSDLYVISGEGIVLVRWDHHLDEGLPIYLTDVPLSTKLLVMLNQLGVEMEVLYAN